MFTDSGLPMILATALVASLRMSEDVTASTGIFVKRFKVGIFFDSDKSELSRKPNGFVFFVDVER